MTNLNQPTSTNTHLHTIPHIHIHSYILSESAKDSLSSISKCFMSRAVFRGVVLAPLGDVKGTNEISAKDTIKRVAIQISSPSLFLCTFILGRWYTPRTGRLEVKSRHTCLLQRRLLPWRKLSSPNAQAASYKNENNKQAGKTI